MFLCLSRVSLVLMCLQNLFKMWNLQPFEKSIWIMKCRQNCEIWMFEKEKDNTVRHGICQIFYSSEIPNPFKFYPKETRKSQHFWQKIENWVCFTNLFSTIYQFLCIYLLQYKLSPVILWKLLPEFGKFTELVIGKHRHSHTRSRFLRAFKCCSTLCPHKNMSY